MTLGLWLGMGIAVAMGYAVAASVGLVRPLALVASLAVCLGLGATSCLYFAWCLFAPAGARGYIWLEISCLVILSMVGVSRRWTRSASSTGRQAVRGAAHHPLWWTIAATCAVATLISLALFALQSWANPSGEWDAWCIWSNRATLIYRAQDPWLPLVHRLPEVMNPSYPLLLPLSVSRLWLYASAETTAAPAAVAGLFLLATVGVMVAGLSTVRRTPVQGFLAGLVVVSTPAFVPLSANQYADLPVGSYFLAAAILWAWAETGDDAKARARHALAGTAAALSAWTKNEGTLFLALFFAVLAVRAAATAWDRRRRSRDLLACALGAIPVLLVVVTFKMAHAPPDRWAAQALSGASLARIMDLSRYVRILGAAVADVRLFPWPLLVCSALLLGPVREARIRVVAYLLAILLTLQAAGYVSVFLTSPWDLSWHLATAWTRTCYQLWPLAVFLTFLAGKPLQLPARL